jgi:hypothetical protein
MSTFKVIPLALNLRSAPKVMANNVLAELPKDHLVTKLAEVDPRPWWKIGTTLQGSNIEGYVNSRFLEPGRAPEIPDLTPVFPGIPEVHLTLTSGLVIKRTGKNGRAFPLSEAGQPRRNGTDSGSRKAQLAEIIHWLKVDSSARYLPENSATFCNIYAYDFCFLAGAYLPRVWWNRKAIATLAGGTVVRPVYSTTVTELNANSLCNWLEEFGPDFGWRRSFDLTELQQAANEGQVAVICAQRKDLNRSGHICLVVPETPEHPATRDREERVKVPIQSQAGSTNFRYGGRAWWPGTQFQKHSFWIHA